MINNNINFEATEMLSLLQRIDCLSENTLYSVPVLLLPLNYNIFYRKDDKVQIRDNKSDEFVMQKDLIEIIEILDPLNVEYKKTNILTPRKYAESLTCIPMHLCTQCIILSKVTSNSAVEINTLIKNTKYGKHKLDNFWLNCNSRSYVKEDDIIIVLNRRIGGWDGTKDRPVIELLAGGGHVPNIWNTATKSFEQLTPEQNIKKELCEELKITVETNSLQLLGGFFNSFSSELVVLYSFFVDPTQILTLQSNTLDNKEENIEGLYLGLFSDIMSYYKYDATFFAGSDKAKYTNFPMQQNLMRRIYKIISMHK